jgi:hypothetical protein
MGERDSGGLRLDFDRRLKLEFHGSKVTSDAGLLPFRELDEALGLTEAAGERLVDPRTGRNGQHGMVGLFRQSTFGRLGDYEDVNDADRLGHDPAEPVCRNPGAGQFAASESAKVPAGTVRRSITSPIKIGFGKVLANPVDCHSLA